MDGVETKYEHAYEATCTLLCMAGTGTAHHRQVAKVPASRFVTAV